MPKENINQEIRMKKIDEIGNYFIEETNRNELMSKKHKKVCRVLNYIEHSLDVTTTITRWVSISVFGTIVVIPIGIASSPIILKICVTTAGIKKYKSITNRKKKKHD